MAVRSKGKKWQADFMYEGDRLRQSFDTKAEAEAWELEARAALKRGQPVPQAAAQTLGGKDSGTLANVLRSAEALHWGRLRNSSKTVANAKIFVAWAGPSTPAHEALAQTKINKFVEYLIEKRRVKNSTLNRYMSAVSVLIRFANLRVKPTLPWFKEGQGRVRFFSPEEEQAVIRLLDQWDRDDYRDLFMFLTDTGLRPWEECCKAKWANVSATKITVLGKNGEWRDVPLTRRAQAILARQPRTDAGPFTRIKTFTAEDVWDRVRNHIPGLEGTVWYTCRHTFASRLVQAGKSLKQVAVLMGNSAAIVDKVYSHLAPDHLKDAVEALEVYGKGLKVV